jgi:hypothetical protein
MRHGGIAVGLGLIICGIFSLRWAIAPATASLVTFQFAGNVTGVASSLATSGFSVRQPFAVTYTFDSATPDGLKSECGSV